MVIQAMFLSHKILMRHVAGLNEDQHRLKIVAPNDDSDKSDCDGNDLHDFKSSLKHVERSLPHKKRIANELSVIIINNSSSLIQHNKKSISELFLPKDETIDIRFNPTFACSLCGDVMAM
jgi:hypothetical protein